MIESELKNNIKSELASDEKLLWAGRAQGIRINRIALIYTIIMSLFLALFAAVIISEFPEDSFWMIIIALIIIGPGAYMIFSPTREIYILTTKRIIIKRPILSAFFNLGDKVEIKPARWAGKNSLKIIETVRNTSTRKKYRVEILHGLSDPDGFLNLLSQVEYQVAARGVES